MKKITSANEQVEVLEILEIFVTYDYQRLELSVRLNADWLGGIDSSSQPIPSSGH